MKSGTIERVASGRNIGRGIETDIREPPEYDDLVDLTMGADFADAAAVAGVSGLPRRSRSQLHVPTVRRSRAAFSCPAWVAPRKAYSENRGPHSADQQEADRTAER